MSPRRVATSRFIQFRCEPFSCWLAHIFTRKPSALQLSSYDDPSGYISFQDQRHLSDSSFSSHSYRRMALAQHAYQMLFRDVRVSLCRGDGSVPEKFQAYPEIHRRCAGVMSLPWKVFMPWKELLEAIS